MKISSQFAERYVNLESLKLKSAFETLITVREGGVGFCVAFWFFLSICKGKGFVFPDKCMEVVCILGNFVLTIS